MKRSGFARKVYVRAPAAPLRRVERSGVIARITCPAAPVAKESPVKHEGYRRLVAAYPCKNCGIWGYSQAAHPNAGKGMGMKTDDRLCFPLCCDRPGVRGCHSAFDQGAAFSKEGRRLIEQAWGADTRRQITAAGEWPADLPPVPTTQEETAA